LRKELDELNSFRSRDVYDFMVGAEEGDDVMDAENEDAVDVDALQSAGRSEVASAKEQGTLSLPAPCEHEDSSS
jgi:hypothetical protein